MNKESQSDFFHQKEFFVERKLNEKGELVLVSQKRPVDFGQFPNAINFDKYPKFDESEKIIEGSIYFIPEFKKTKKSKSKKLYIAKSPFYY